MASLATDTERPLCKCHGEPMHKNGFRNGKRHWRCSVAHLASSVKWNQAHPEQVREAVRKYSKTQKGRERTRRYRQSEKGIAMVRAGNRRYRQSERGKETARLAHQFSNPRRLRVGNMYLGMVGLTQHEMKELTQDGNTE